jgi:glycine/D-amino acid oxidase-like deaminating enzyme
MCASTIIGPPERRERGRHVAKHRSGQDAARRSVCYKREVSDVVVVGGGLVGVSAAYRLARLGAQVTLVDAGHDGQATVAGAGIISPGDRFDEGGAILPLVRESTNYYPELLASLAEDGEARTGYEVIGALHVATSPEEAARLPAVAAQALERRAAGFGPSATSRRSTRPPPQRCSRRSVRSRPRSTWPGPRGSTAACCATPSAGPPAGAARPCSRAARSSGSTATA